MVWDDRQCDEAWLLAPLRAVGPQATSFPVVIGAAFHPFPFRTRTLSPPPPMVLHAQVCGRVGHCRDYFRRKGPLQILRRAFFLRIRIPGPPDYRLRRLAPYATIEPWALGPADLAGDVR